MWEDFMQGLSDSVTTMVDPMSMPLRLRRLAILTAPASLPIILVTVASLSALLAILSMLDSLVHEFHIRGMDDLWNLPSLRDLISE